MEKFIENYYKFITCEKEYPDKKINVYTDNKKDKPRVYIYKNSTVWLINGKDDNLKYPESNQAVGLDEIIAANQNYKLSETGYFNIFPDIQLKIKLPRRYYIKKITADDKDIFDRFLSKCSKEDKEQGQVSCEDDLVYGAFIDEEIVSVSSLWYWGDDIADIGVLTINEHRQKGLVKACLNAILHDTNRTILWRSASNNKNSVNAAAALGFVRVGSIYLLEKNI